MIIPRNGTDTLPGTSVIQIYLRTIWFIRCFIVFLRSLLSQTEQNAAKRKVKVRNRVHTIKCIELFGPQSESSPANFSRQFRMQTNVRRIVVLRFCTECIEYSKAIPATGVKNIHHIENKVDNSNQKAIRRNLQSRGRVIPYTTALLPAWPQRRACFSAASLK